MSFKHLKGKINLCSRRRYPTEAIKVRRFQTCAIKNKNEIKRILRTRVAVFLTGTKTQRDDGGRILLGDNRC
jgi:hypothetical protein